VPRASSNRQAAGAIGAKILADVEPAERFEFVNAHRWV
jgi:hypothetical protein